MINMLSGGHCFGPGLGGIGRVDGVIENASLKMMRRTAYSSRKGITEIRVDV